MHIMDSRQTADFLDISYSKFMRMFSQNSADHPPFVLYGKERKFIKEDVEEWVKSRRVIKA